MPVMTKASLDYRVPTPELTNLVSSSSDSESMMKEKEEMSNREEEMQAVINRLKDTLNQRNAEDENRPTRQQSE